MKKTTFLIVIFLLINLTGQSQCIRTTMHPSSTIVSNNLGLTQTILGSPFTSDYSQISNLLIGEDYIFTCKLTSSETDKYITVTDFANNVIAQGPSPLTVEAISTSQIRLHYADDATCASTSAVHTVTLTAVLDCYPPLNLTAYDITTTTASFSWEPQGDEDSWQVLVLPNGTAAPTSTTTGTDVLETPSYTYDALTAGGKFQLYVRANCPSGFSIWNGPLNFESACTPTATLNENFDTTATATLPLCWKQVKNGVGSVASSYAYVGNYLSYSTPNVVYLYSADEDDANLILVSPPLTNLAAGTHRLKFFARAAGNADQNLQFGTMDSNTNEGTFTELDDLTVTPVYEEYSIDYTNYDGTDTFIAIRHNGTQNSSILIDNIRWEVAPLCADVSLITIPPASITDTTAMIDWSANGQEVEWDVVYGPTTVTDPDTLVPIVPSPTGNSETSLNGLIPNTTYKVWVRSVCGDNNGIWIGPKTFKTACGSITAINENFDALAYGTLPACWAAVKNEAVASANAMVINYNGYSPTCAISMSNSNSPATADIMLVSPLLSNIANGTHRVRFYAKSSGATGSLQVGSVDTNTAGATFNSIQTIALTLNYAEYVVEFNSTDITDSYLAFRHDTPAAYNSIFIDNIIWEPIPSCPDITGLTVSSFTSDTATINWNSTGTQTNWDIVYGPVSVTDPETLTPLSPAPTGNPTSLLTELSDNTSYKVWVRTDCGTENGIWAGPVTFKTLCLPVNTFNENFDTTATQTLPDCWTGIKNGPGISQYASSYVTDSFSNSPSKAMVLNNANSGSGANILLVSPNLGNLSAGTHIVKFFAKSSGLIGSLMVGTVDNTLGTATFTEFETVSITSTFEEYEVDFSSYEGDALNIAFRHNTTEMLSGIFIDDIRWIPKCADVINVEVGQETTETATVNWQSQGNELNWQVVYGPDTVTDPETLTESDLLTETEFLITGLTANSAYNVWVRPICSGPNGEGLWAGPFLFKTRCEAATLPFSQDFETSELPQMPECTILENLDNSSNFTTGTAGEFGFDGNVLQYTGNCNASANAWYYTKGLMLTGGTEYKIRYKYGGNTAPGGNNEENLKVMYGNSPNADSMTEGIDDHSFSTNTAVTNEVAFVPSSDGIYYFGFNVYSGACQNTIFIDDISISEVLARDNFDVTKIKFYPNPVKDILHLSHTQAISQVSIFNLLGQNILENNYDTNEVEIDINTLSSGSYIVKTISKNQTFIIKIVKD